MADPLGDEVEGRAAANAQRFGIALDAPTGAFSDRIDEAAIHAAESARADHMKAIIAPSGQSLGADLSAI